MTQTTGIARFRRLIASLAALATVALTFAMVASAEAKPLGATTLKPDRATFEALAGLGVTVKPTGPAKAGKRGIAFPITDAKLRKNLTGSIDHRGGLKFAGGGAKLAVKNFIVRIGERKSKLIAFAGKQRVRLLTLDLSEAKVRRGGKTVSGVKAALARPGAQALSATFGAKIPAGTPIGKVTVAFR